VGYEIPLKLAWDELADLIAAQVVSVTRTDCTQPSSNACNPMDLLKAIAPTEPPGFFGVPVGEPTVPKMNDKVMKVSRD